MLTNLEHHYCYCQQIAVLYAMLSLSLRALFQELSCFPSFLSSPFFLTPKSLLFTPISCDNLFSTRGTACVVWGGGVPVWLGGVCSLVCDVT